MTVYFNTSTIFEKINGLNYAKLNFKTNNDTKITAVNNKIITTAVSVIIIGNQIINKLVMSLSFKCSNAFYLIS